MSHEFRTPMSGRVVIREAQAQDAAALKGLYRSLLPDANVEVDPQRLAAIAADPHNYVFVCEVDGCIRGTLLLTICLDAMYGRQPFGVIENVVVAEGARGSGFGSLLMEHVESVCRQQDCSKIMLLSSATRLQAHRFFEEHGFSSTNKVGFVKYRRQFRAE